MIGPFTIVIVIGLAVLLYAFLMFDRIVKGEYEANRTAWEAEGKPMGFFWKAKECTMFRSSIARNQRFFAWLFATPAWAYNLADCRSWLLRFRICVLAWILLVLVVFFLTTSR